MATARIEKVVAPPEWVSASNIIYDREVLIRTARGLESRGDNFSLCGQLFDRHLMIPRNRIGSQSSEGEVYRVTYLVPGPKPEELLCAFKTMPITGAESEEKNEKEIDIATLASDLVKAGKSANFPLVFASGHCPDVTYYVGSKFSEPSWDYACGRALSEAFPDKRRRIAALQQQGLPNRAILSRLSEKEGVCDDLRIPGDFLLSELASEDMYSWTNKRHSLSTWRSVLSSVVRGIYDLHYYLRVSHEDLHLGNVLIANDLGQGERRASYVKYAEVPLIHDFGKSAPLTEENRWEDVRHFFSSLAKVADELDSPYLKRLSSHVLRVYVKLYEDEAARSKVDWQQYQLLVDAIEAVELD